MKQFVLVNVTNLCAYMLNKSNNPYIKHNYIQFF